MLLKIICSTVIVFVIGIGQAMGQNPIVKDQFTADPTARIFEGKMYVYPSHDVNCGTGWFCMKDYHVFSSEDLVSWKDHGVILHQNDVAWVDTSANAMWAPDAMEKDGRYYFYFPAISDSTMGFPERAIGVATADTPEGPFQPEPKPMEGVAGIDPNTFIDHDGQAYFYWSGGGIWGAELNSNMLEIDTEPLRLDEDHPQSGLREGPFMFKREGLYYLTYPRVIENTEALVYATGDHPLGTFEYQGVFMDEHDSGCWTNHHSIVHYEGQWYLFYHHNDYSPDFDKNRSIRIDSLSFNSDGTIQKVTPTFRGVGITKATQKIQIDRYTKLSESGASITFLDSADTFKGWKTILSDQAWVQYNAVHFGDEPLKQIQVKAQAETEGVLEVRSSDIDEPIIAKVDVSESPQWVVTEVPLSSFKPGIHDLVIQWEGDGLLELDWIRFR